MLFNKLFLLVCTVGYVSAKTIRILHINDHHSNLDEQVLDLSGSLLPPGLTNVTTLRAFYGKIVSTDPVPFV
jgi:2',3'-cyclic-nucleotide 2'-phosphodiesterase (5'-nucleotidase family)